jgi:hypothetical protein
MAGEMKSVFRPTSAGELPAVQDFLARTFGIDRSAPPLDAAMMRWKYWDPRHDWDEPRSYVLEKDGEITAHAGVWPQVFPTARGIQMIDWAAAKEAAGAGLVLVQKLAGICDFMYSIGGTEMTRKVLPGFGFVEHGSHWRGVAPLRPWRQMATHQVHNWRLAPRLVRNFMWSKRGANRSWDSRAFVPADGFLEYLSRCPAAKFHFFEMTAKDGDKGRFAISVLRGQARLAGVWLATPGAEDWEKAYSLARRTAFGLAEANELVAMGSDGMTREGAAKAGFHVAPGPPVFLLDKKKKFAPPEGFQFQLCDNDGAFLDTGDPGYWS